MTEWETAAPAVAETPDIKLFGKWSTDDVQINDISLQDYIAVKEKYAKYLPHSAGRYAAKRFRKAQCPIVERLTNSMMMHGRNNGKKLMTVRIVKHAFEIIHLLTGENPLQVLMSAITSRAGSAAAAPKGAQWRPAPLSQVPTAVHLAVYMACVRACSRLITAWEMMFSEFQHLIISSRTGTMCCPETQFPLGRQHQSAFSVRRCCRRSTIWWQMALFF
uniref:Small ribosomal subunit protein uS7 domain-containing protein n=1 Tax=Capra hircus TaxID=9925 RepID=A0A8C2QYQ5_CAPHI